MATVIKSRQSSKKRMGAKALHFGFLQVAIAIFHGQQVGDITLYNLNLLLHCFYHRDYCV